MSKMVMVAFLVLGGLAVFSVAQTAPAPAPATPPPAKSMLDEMLKPASTQPARPLQPAPGPVQIDRTTGVAAVAPGAQALTLLREGSYLVDRTGRIVKGANQQWEFNFDADGQAMKDPPVVVMPNLKLMLMEDQVHNASRDLRFRITGQVTEYRGRNYVLIEKVVVLND